jgi:DNA-binding SARP family transcriptional activator/tetratricopeptide (TPR) repeat protein
MRIEIELCGRLSVDVEGQQRADSLPGRQGRVLLAYLAVHRHRPVSRDELSDALWDECPPSTAGSSLNALLSKLRHAVGPDALFGTESLQLAEDTSVDLEHAERALEDARVALSDERWEQARQRAREAAGIFGRGLLPGYEAEWLEDRRRDVEDHGMEALECLGEAALALGGHRLAEAEQAAAALITAAPYRESGHRLKMRALASEGNVAEAVRVYHALKRQLDDELGITPSAVVQQLFDSLLLGNGEEPSPGARSAGRRGSPSRIAAPQFVTRTNARFVGRETELARLNELLAQARLRRRQLVLLKGEPGIGKTRIAEHFAGFCLAADATVLAGRCDADALVPYQPFVQALRPYVAATPQANLRERLGVHANELARVLPELAETAPHGDTADGHDRYRLFEAAAALLAEITGAGLTTLILDDLQWADPPTLLLLRHVVRATRNAPLLIVGIYRDNEPEANLLETLADLRRDEFFETIRIQGLDRDDARLLIDSQSKKPVPAATSQVLWEETAGNPFFIEEIVQNLSAHADWSSAAVLDRAAIPEGVRAVVLRRLAHLSPDARRMLEVAAVIGERFSAETLEAVEDLAPLSESQLDAALDEAVKAQVIAELGEPEPRESETEPTDEDQGYAFAHSLLRQTLYEDMTRSRRARLHLRIGEALERVSANKITPPLAELAHHYLAAPPSRAAGKAIAYALKAARQAVDMLAYEEAARLYSIAFAASERHYLDEREREQVLLALGDVQIKLGVIDDARATFTQTLMLARDRRDPEAFAKAALGLGAGGYMAGGVVDAKLVALLEESLHQLGTEDSVLRARLLGRLADELSFSEARERCAALSEEAVSVARRVGDPGAYSYALTARHWSLWGPENLENRLEAARELVTLGEHTAKKGIAVEGHRWCMLDLLELGDIAAVDAEIDVYARLARERRLASELWFIPLFRAMRMLLDGRLADAERVSAEALRLGIKVHPANAEQAHLLQTLALRREQGRLADLEDVVGRYIRRYPAIPGWRCVLAHLHAELGRDEDAARELDELSAKRFACLPPDAIWLGAIASLADTCAALGDAPHAETLYALLEPFADRNIVIGWASACQGSAARHLGLLAAVLGRRDVAASHFEHAIAANESMGARPWLARTQVDYAGMLLDAPEPGDEEHAALLLDHATATASELGLRVIGERASATADRLGAAAAS